MRVLLLTPPMTQLNTPYPATAYLTGFLRAHGGELALDVRQADASLLLFLRLFGAPLVERMAQVLTLRARKARRSRGIVASVLDDPVTADGKGSKHGCPRVGVVRAGRPAAPS